MMTIRDIRAAPRRLLDRLLPVERVGMPFLRCGECRELERGMEITEAVAKELPEGSSAVWRGGLYACLYCLGHIRMRDSARKADGEVE